MARKSSVWVLRGPVILAGVTASLLWPYISTWTTQSMLQATIAILGVVVFLMDILKITKCRIRHTVSNILDQLVLDDFLRWLHDPETGVIPCMVGSFMGASSMYALRLDDEQKTTLMQASLWTEKDQARSILLDAGGVKALLPGSVQEWLDEGKDNTQKKKTPVVASYKKEPILVETVQEEEAESESSSSSSFATSPKSTNPDCNTSRGYGADQSHPDEVSVVQRAQLIPPPGIPTDPIMEMIKIVRDMTIDKLRPWFASISESKLEIVGTVAAVGLCAQTAMRVRANHSFWGTACAMCLSGTVAGAFSTIVIRQAVLGSIHDLDSFKLISSAILSRSIERIKRMIAKDKRWSATVALLVLAMVGRAKTRSTATIRRKQSLGQWQE